MATGMPAAADNPERIKAEIERTRQQLGDTVERLVAKTDVKRRARAEVTALTGRVRTTLTSTGRSATGSARQTMGKGASTASENRVPLAIGAGVMLVVFSLAIWQRTRKHGKGA